MKSRNYRKQPYWALYTYFGKKNVKNSRYRPGGAQRVPGS